MTKEEIIISMTTWSARISNLPVVLDSIFQQTIPPDRVVVNLAFDEIIPNDVNQYFVTHQIEVFRTDDTKVYKKFIPTLLRYPEACVINIDDDVIYKPDMIESFINRHEKYPNYPISGNDIYLYGLKCHCGEASLTKYAYFGEMLNYIDQDLRNNCPSSDIVYSFLAALNGHPYIEQVQNISQSYNEVNSYTKSSIQIVDGIEKSYQYLLNRLGVPHVSIQYIEDEYLKRIAQTIYGQEEYRIIRAVQENVRHSYPYRIGQIITKPLKFISNNFTR